MTSWVIRMKEMRTKWYKMTKGSMDTTKGTGSSQVHCRHMRQGPKSWFSHGTHVTKASSVRQAVGSCMGIASVAYRMRARLHYISFLLYCSVCLESQTSPQPTACCPGWCVYIHRTTEQATSELPGRASALVPSLCLSTVYLPFTI